MIVACVPTRGSVGMSPRNIWIASDEIRDNHYDKIEVSKKVSVCKHVRKPVCTFPFKFTLQNHCVSC